MKYYYRHNPMSIIIIYYVNMERLVLTFIIVLLSIAVNVVRFIFLTILVPPSNPSVSHQTNESNQDIDKIVHRTTAGEGSAELP